MKNIKHIVYIMMENRSFDHVLGWLYKKDQPNLFLPPNTSPKIYQGLNTGNYYNQDAQGNKHYVTEIPDFSDNPVPSVDPHEDYVHVNMQLFGVSATPPSPTPPTMMGFLKDFADQNKSNPAEIMDCYSINSMPVLNFLAGVYAVSDAYYSSVPTQTNCNRAFAGSGNSIGSLSGTTTGMVDNHWGPDWDHPWDPIEFNGPTIWNVLNDHGFYTPNDWMIFYNQTWPGHGTGDYCFTQDMFWPSLQNDIDHFRDIQEFFDLAKSGNLPTFSFLEPAWYEDLWNGNDYHPPGNVVPGEKFLVDLYGAIKNSPSWNETLFIINFDEHGGTYDHQPPPWGASPPWLNPVHGTPPPAALEYKFKFDRFGVRVPLVLVSPYIQSGTVFRSNTNVPLDHTSVIATILNHFNIPKANWKLGSRVYNAPTFEFVLTLDTPRTDSPEIKSPSPPQQNAESSTPSDLQLMIVHRMLARTLQQTKYPKDQFQALYDQHFKDIKTMKQLNAAIDAVMKGMKGNK